MFQDWIGELREAEIAAGGSGWEATWASLHWQQRVAYALHCALAARLLDDLHVHDHILHEMGLLGADSSEVLHGPRLARAT